MDKIALFVYVVNMFVIVVVVGMSVFVVVVVMSVVAILSSLDGSSIWISFIKKCR